ncbi:MAG: PLP-dependent aminotransferase family protein, partial [Planctomycetota bacterium]
LTLSSTAFEKTLLMSSSVEPTAPVSLALSHRAELAQGAAIGKLMRQALQYPDLISLAAGFVDNATLPCEAVSRSLDRIAADPSRMRTALQYDASAGSKSTRECVAEWSYQNYPGVCPSPERIVLSAGSNQLLHLLSEVVLDPGDIVIVAEPTYFVYLGTIKGIGARAVGVAADEDGMCIDALEQTLAKLASEGQAQRVKVIYTVTEFDNPAGSTLSLERRHRLLEIVARWRKEHSPLLIFSDNAYQLLRYSGASLPPLLALENEARDFVVELGTFSKCFSTGIRVGWGVLPDELVPAVLDMKSNIDFGSPHFSQVIVEEAVRSGEVDNHLPIIRESYSQKLDVMLEALEMEFAGVPGVRWRQPHGGLYVWLEMPEEIATGEDSLYLQACLHLGVIYVPGHHCYPRDSRAPLNTIRLSFGVQCESGIRKGIALMRKAFDQIKAKV